MQKSNNKFFFDFSRKDKIGTLAISVLILILGIVLNVGAVVELPDPFDVNMDSVNLFVSEMDKKGSNSTFDSNLAQSSNKKIVYKTFNPNKLNLEEWKELGFSEKQAKSILNYKKSIGAFRKKEQLKKVYVISEDKYNELEPYILISETNFEKPQPQSKKIEFDNNESNNTPISVQEINLNKATKEELIAVKGIGSYYADKIIKFRQRTGGFIEKEQINELSISEEAKQALQDIAIIDIRLVKKTNINTASKSELRAIPYANWLIVSRILKRRDQVKLTNLDFLTKEEISDSDLSKMLLYIEF